MLVPLPEGRKIAKRALPPITAVRACRAPAVQSAMMTANCWSVVRTVRCNHGGAEPLFYRRQTIVRVRVRTSGGKDFRRFALYEELKKTVRLLSNVLAAKEVAKSEAVGLLRVITDYAYGLDTLDRYDYQQLEVSATTAEEPFRATYENAMEALQVLRDKFGGSALFACEKDSRRTRTNIRPKIASMPRPKSAGSGLRPMCIRPDRPGDRRCGQSRRRISD